MKKMTKPSNLVFIAITILLSACGVYGIAKMFDNGHPNIDGMPFYLAIFTVTCHLAGIVLAFLIITIVLKYLIDFFWWVIDKADKEWEEIQ